jgi:hypothetical protein
VQRCQPLRSKNELSRHPLKQLVTLVREVQCKNTSLLPGYRSRSCARQSSRKRGKTGSIKWAAARSTQQRGAQASDLAQFKAPCWARRHSDQRGWHCGLAGRGDDADGGTPAKADQVHQAAQAPKALLYPPKRGQPSGRLRHEKRTRRSLFHGGWRQALPRTQLKAPE